MSGFIILTLCAIAATTLGTSEQEYKNEFLRLTAKLSAEGGDPFGSRSGRIVSSAARYKIFKTRYDEVKRVNSQGRKYVAATNEFSLKTPEELKAYTGLNISMMSSSRSKLMMSTRLAENAPDAVDWRADGKVTEMKSQGDCGSCWAFAAVASVESHYAILTDTLKMMSEQQVLDCTYIDQGHDGCNGGWMADAFEQIKNKLGNRLATSESYQYTEKAADTCDTSLFDKKKKGITNALVEAYLAKSVYTSVPYDGSEVYSPYETNLAAAVSIGPVTVAIEVVNSMYSYLSGIYDETDCKYQVNHAVTVVAYDAQKFHIKNSWGSGWGDGGYINFDRSIKNQCFIGQWPEYPNMELTGNDEDDSSNANPCKPNPCQNRGKCQRDGSDYTCKCKKKFTGSNCQEKINDCRDKSDKCPDSKNDPKCLKKKRFVRNKCQLSCGFCYL